MESFLHSLKLCLYSDLQQKVKICTNKWRVRNKNLNNQNMLLLPKFEMIVINSQLIRFLCLHILVKKKKMILKIQQEQAYDVNKKNRYQLWS